MRIVKKYANRKLYDTVDKTYVSMGRLAELVKSGEEVSVIDNQTGQDITVSVLSQLLAREKRDGDSEELTDMLSGILRKSGDAVFGYAKKYSSRWQGAMSMAEDELDKFAKLFLKDREMGEDEKRDFIQGFKGHAEKLKFWIGEKVDQRVGDIMKVMKVVSREEFEDVNAAVSSLEKRVQELEKKTMDS